MKFHCVGAHQSFLNLLAAKLDADFQFEPRTCKDPDLKQCDAVIFGAHESDTQEFSASMRELKDVVLACSETPVIVFLPGNDRMAVRTSVATGAYDHITSTTPLVEVAFSLRRAANFHDLSNDTPDQVTQVRRPVPLDEDVVTDAKMLALHAMVRKLAPTDAPVLITGESGTGKEVLAKLIHESSPRAGHPFVAVACSSLPESLIEAELFGHERGAFTGANVARPGRFEAVGQGTLLLDEIGELSPALQVKLLRVLQERTFERLGSNQSRPVRARILCATNRDMKNAIAVGAFRQDFFYRISTIELNLPPLRERQSDLLVLANHFIRTAALRMNVPVPKMTPAVMSALQEYSWPGNIRQLQNVIERAVLLAEGNTIRVGNLPPELIQVSSGQTPASEFVGSLDEELRRFKKKIIERALIENSHNKVQAARALGIARSSLHRLIEELQIASPRTSDDGDAGGDVLPFRKWA